jgi:hypothetical protein
MLDIAFVLDHILTQIKQGDTGQYSSVLMPFFNTIFIYVCNIHAFVLICTVYSIHLKGCIVLYEKSTVDPHILLPCILIKLIMKQRLIQIAIGYRTCKVETKDETIVLNSMPFDNGSVN